MLVGSQHNPVHVRYHDKLTKQHLVSEWVLGSVLSRAQKKVQISFFIVKGCVGVNGVVFIQERSVISRLQKFQNKCLQKIFFFLSNDFWQKNGCLSKSLRRFFGYFQTFLETVNNSNRRHSLKKYSVSSERLF